MDKQEDGLDVRKLLEPIQRGTVDNYVRARDQRKNGIYAALVAFQPDAWEAMEFVDALAAGLKARYPNCSEVILRLTLLKADLERLDYGQSVDAKDALGAYEEQTGRKRAGGGL